MEGLLPKSLTYVVHLYIMVMQLSNSLIANGKRDGVQNATVNFMTQKMIVEFNEGRISVI